MIVLIASVSFSQTGQIKGIITDKTTEPLPFVKIVLSQNGNSVGFAQSDFDGMYILKDINPGVYEIELRFVGYIPIRIEGITVHPDKITFMDHQMSSDETRIVGCCFNCGYHKVYSDEDREVGANK